MHCSRRQLSYGTCLHHRLGRRTRPVGCSDGCSTTATSSSSTLATATGSAPSANLVDRAATAVVGDLSDHRADARRRPRGVNRSGRWTPSSTTPASTRGPQVMPVNIVAPYLLTALIDRPQRLIYLSSGAHRAAEPAWTASTGAGAQRAPTQTASSSSPTLAVTVARRWPDVFRQRRRPRLGAHTDGRTQRTRRSAARTTSRRSGSRPATTPDRAYLWRLLVSPTPDRTAPSRARQTVPGPAARGTRTLHRYAPAVIRRPRSHRVHRRARRDESDDLQGAPSSTATPCHHRCLRSA
jgi:hypothetical protein